MGCYWGWFQKKQLLHKLFWVTSSPEFGLMNRAIRKSPLGCSHRDLQRLDAPSHPKPWMGHPKLMLVRSVWNDFIQKLEKLKPLKWGATGILSEETDHQDLLFANRKSWIHHRSSSWWELIQPSGVQSESEFTASEMNIIFCKNSTSSENQTI